MRDAGNRWVFPEQADQEDLVPHAVRWLIIPGLAGSGATHGVEDARFGATALLGA